ncbi:tRNA pseudouridine(38-40) synthase [Helicocarpus griseus UAMH5409]|uniref:tRNA pseudouridine synthase 1 n=1 Tax=Helicocarpus griseus UAMH5409 TaxID=1447875 RepID=A0A2B7XWN2_9EURO|nr:tRNA pseudouridine(38-40) synthase [Helicocarpus griseus UAMH5409]
MDSQQQPPNPTTSDKPTSDQQTAPIPNPPKDQGVSEPRPEGDRKRKLEPNDTGRAGGGRRAKGKDLGRKAWSRQPTDKRARTEASRENKRRKIEEGKEGLPIYATEFSKEDIEADQRRPKKKVAVLIGYSGSGYHGMQLSESMKTIEGDLFTAFVAAGAISKANATDPKKSSFVRCARTDKGVHAAGNVVSLKLIVEDADIVQKINEHLNPQIRVWGYEITTKSFSAYQLCDSRVYEYLIPTHCFLPPHPSTHLAQKLLEIAKQENDLEGYNQRQAEVATYWDEVDEKYIKPILQRLPEATRKRVEQSLLFRPDSAHTDNSAAQSEQNQPDPSSKEGNNAAANNKETTEQTNDSRDTSSSEKTQPMSIAEGIRTIRAAYFQAKREYRIPKERMDRINAALALYTGTKNFYNYTIQKTFRDPSAKRLIKSFKISRDPVIINGTEWLSLKVHGQSFMMHQIRKMVAMVAMLVRSGGDIERINETYGDQKIPIPKAPGLGLLLERPIFDSYNKRNAAEFGKNPIDFSKYEKEIEEFKQREIYERIFREEEESNTFGNFFNHIDTFQGNSFLFVSSGGIAASKEPETTAQPMTGKAALEEVESEPEDELVNNGEEGG